MILAGLVLLEKNYANQSCKSHPFSVSSRCRKTKVSLDMLARGVCLYSGVPIVTHPPATLW